jgi:hypothetical protein
VLVILHQVAGLADVAAIGGSSATSAELAGQVARPTAIAGSSATSAELAGQLGQA